MPKPVLPSHDSASYELLSLTALCGEFPCDSAARLISSESYRKKIVTGLTHNRLLRIFSRNHLRGYRLGIRGKLYRFYAALELHKRSGIIVCFDFQEDALRPFCGSRIKLQTIDFSDFERRFLNSP